MDSREVTIYRASQVTLGSALGIIEGRATGKCHTTDGRRAHGGSQETAVNAVCLEAILNYPPLQDVYFQGT